MDHDAHDPTPGHPSPGDSRPDDAAPGGAGVLPIDPVADRSARGGQGRTLLVGAAVVVAAIVAAVALTSGGGDRDPVAGPAVAGGTSDGPTPAATPAFGLTDAVAELPAATLDGFAGGPPTAVADLLGGVPIVLNFWATWCAPCVAEMPDLQALHLAAGDDLRVVGVNTRDALPNAEPFAEELGITYDNYVDREGEYFLATGSFGMPTTLFVRPDGTVAYRQTGPMTLEQAADLVAEHLGVALQTAP